MGGGRKSTIGLLVASSDIRSGAKTRDFPVVLGQWETRARPRLGVKTMPHHCWDGGRRELHSGQVSKLSTSLLGQWETRARQRSGVKTIYITVGACYERLVVLAKIIPKVSVTTPAASTRAFSEHAAHDHAPENLLQKKTLFHLGQEL